MFKKLTALTVLTLIGTSALFGTTLNAATVTQGSVSVNPTMESSEWEHEGNPSGGGKWTYGVFWRTGHNYDCSNFLNHERRHASSVETDDGKYVTSPATNSGSTAKAEAKDDGPNWSAYYRYV